jgi:hypothetical protein
LNSTRQAIVEILYVRLEPAFADAENRQARDIGIAVVLGDLFEHGIGRNVPAMSLRRKNGECLLHVSESSAIRSRRKSRRMLIERWSAKSDSRRIAFV